MVQVREARRRREMWPACRAPMVGTRAMRWEERVASLRRARKGGMVRWTVMVDMVKVGGG